MVMPLVRRLGIDVVLRASSLRLADEILHLLAPLGEPVDPETPVWELECLGPDDRSLLYEAAVCDHEQDCADEREQADRLRPLAPDADCNGAADARAEETDRDRQPDGHRIGTRNREPRKASGDEPENHDQDDGSEHDSSLRPGL